jgi:hypothetical protein
LAPAGSAGAGFAPACPAAGFPSAAPVFRDLAAADGAAPSGPGGDVPSERAAVDRRLAERAGPVAADARPEAARPVTSALLAAVDVAAAGVVRPVAFAGAAGAAGVVFFAMVFRTAFDGVVPASLAESSRGRRPGTRSPARRTARPSRARTPSVSAMPLSPLATP